MENEATKTLKKYFSSDDGTDIRYLGKGEGARLFADCFQNGEWFAGDVPDMLIKKEETAILIEHFEFDSYPVTRKGSKNRREQDRIERCAERVEPSAQGMYYHNEIRGDSSLQSYLCNCLGSFQRHYQQIGRYKDNLRKYDLISDSVEVKVMFLIEDVSPLGSIISETDGLKALSLHMCKEFLTELEMSPQVDYVLTCSCAGNSQRVWFIDRSDIFEYKKFAKSSEEMNMLKFEPKVLGFKVSIPRSSD